MSYPFGHPANEGEGSGPPYLCPLCGNWHAANACPLDPGDGPEPPPDGPDDDDWPMPEEPPSWEAPGVDHPSWCYGLPDWIFIPKDN